MSTIPAEDAIITSTSASETEDNLIEELKRSLKITENEFLESEIQDLKEFFTVQIVEIEAEETTELEKQQQARQFEYRDLYHDKKTFWLQVYLPVTLRTISEEGIENLKEETPLIWFKIKLKNGKCEVHTEAADEVEVHKVETSNEENEGNDTNSEEAKSEEIDTVPPQIISDYSLPYEIAQVKVSELAEEQDIRKLETILSELSQSKDFSLLNVIEEFYVQLEDINYAGKEVICRDYYYPVFDCRHWGRSKSSTNKTSLNLNSPNSDGSVSYRARALYDFQALMQGELSFQENEILIVLANLGNGWLTARRVSPNDANLGNCDDSMTGLIPENYIERL